MMKNLFYTIIKAAIVVGTLDILAAFLQYFITTGDKNVFTVLKYIASAVFGNQAYSGGIPMIITGLFFHYLIALLFTLFFFWLFAKTDLFAKNKLLTGIVFGIFTWAVMNLVVVPLSRIPDRPFTVANALVSMGILIFCMGIPLAFMADAFYRKANLVARKNS
jgi:uncharacterized membrane protein YagU involved in acid resistance